MTKTVGIFLYADFQLLDATGPITAFEIAGRIRPESYRLAILSIPGGPVRSSSGVSINSIAVADATSIDTLLVSGGNGSRDAMQCPRSIAYLQACASETRRLCSVCSGAFILAAAGLLDGKRVTTHWRRAEQLQQIFPALRVEADRIHIRDGNVWTSAGISAGIDLALALIADDLGEKVARQVAREMVVYYRRPGGQSQFSALADLGGDATVFSPLFEWMRANLSERMTIEQLAERMAMSPRNFSRAFQRVVGISPAKAVERLRLEAARERVESSREPIEQIAMVTGFRDPERMRRAFLRNYGQPPQALRRALA
ncbi:GlxA family transcriptional regulator [Pleomorphomonas oryzae]|uniref:GlxA family transcriptional regulator n=1 Tax=Pleomorphomonas oryzae TaxID=261934 RepID=UPI0004071458|nr:GlxA family transcriptional regulator [Pleomorphomonas oryzae]